MFREEKNQKSGSFLAAAISGFFSVIVALFGQRAADLLEKQERRASKGIILSAVFFTGALFALNGLAILISETLKMGTWSGYGLVGLSLIIIGLIFRK